MRRLLIGVGMSVLTSSGVIAAEENLMRKVFPAWNMAVRSSSNQQALLFFLLFLLLCFVGYKLFLRRAKRKARSTGAQRAGGFYSDINYNGDPTAQLLSPGNLVLLQTIGGPYVPAKIIGVNEKILAAMIMSDELSAFSPGATIKVHLYLDQHHFTVKTHLSRLDSRNPHVCTLQLEKIVTMENLRDPHAISQSMPALVSTLTNEVIGNDEIPFADLYDKVLPEIPVLVVGLDTTCAALRTNSALAFHPGDLLYMQLPVPKNFQVGNNGENDIMLWCDVATTYRQPGDGAATLLVNFITIDQRLLDICQSIGRPFAVVST